MNRRNVIAIVGLAVVFFAGRQSAMTGRGSGEDEANAPVRSAHVSRRRQAVVRDGPGAGGRALRTTAEFRDLFKLSTRSNQAGYEAEYLLSKMNRGELEILARDIIGTQVGTTGYAYFGEVKTVCDFWARLDPDAALSFALREVDGVLRKGAVEGAFSGIATLDPLYAYEQLGRLDSPTFRDSAIRILNDSRVAIRHPDEWLAIMSKDPKMVRSFWPYHAVGEWAMDDPVVAAQRIARLPAKHQPESTAKLARIWAGKDHNAALAWAASLTDEAQQDLAYAGVVAGFAEVDLSGAIDMAQSFSGARRNQALKQAVVSMAKHDFDTALAAVTGLGAEEDRAAVFEHMLSRSYGHDGFDPFHLDGTQIEKILPYLETGALREKALGQWAPLLSKESPERVARALSHLSPEEQEELSKRMSR